MNNPRFIRRSGFAAMLAGLVTLASSFFSFLVVDSSQAEVLGLIVRTALIAIALVGIYFFQKDEAGVLGLIGFLAAFIGNLVILIDFFIGGSMYSLGLILLAAASLRARKFPRWVGTFWILTILIGFPGFFIESLEDAAFVAGAVFLGLAFAGAGYTMWSQARAPAGGRNQNWIRRFIIGVIDE